MNSLKERCTLLCKNKHADTLLFNRDPEICHIAEELARLLLDTNAVNTKWRVESYSGSGEEFEGIVNFLDYLDDDLRGQLLAKGLDLNQNLSFEGVVPFTWLIGNAQNKLVDELLTSAEQNQTLDQRLVWINKTDTMMRYPEPMETETTGLCFGLFSNEGHGKLTTVGQTPLQLVIAKGYTDKSNGGNMDLDVSNLQIAEKLLRLGASQQINYQEPTRGNTALHIAYARRDYNAILLLEKYGATRHIRNKYGELPADMLRLSFSQVEKLLTFHTSPDGHPNTFRLNQEEFNDPHQLEKIKNTIKLERQLIEVNGKDIKIPENTFSFGPIESAAIQSGYATASLLTSDESSIQAAITSVKHRINLLKFIREEAMLHFQNLTWQDYMNKRQVMDYQYNGSSNPFMFDVTQAGYESFQHYVNKHKAEARAATKKNSNDISTFIRNLEDGLDVLEKIMLAKAVKNHDIEQVRHLMSTGIDVQMVFQSLQQELAALHFKKTLGNLVLPLLRSDLSWEDFCTQIDIHYEKAGGQSNPYLPHRQYQLDENHYEEMKEQIINHPNELEEAITFINIDKAEIDSKIIKYERALNLIMVMAPSLSTQDVNVHGSSDFITSIETQKTVLLDAIQGLHNYGEILKQKRSSKGQILVELSMQLRERTTEFYEKKDWDDFPTFKTNIMTFLNSKNSEMASYRIAWPTIVKNIAIALTGLGLFLIAAQLLDSKKSKGRALFLFQKAKTTSEEKIETIKQSIEKFKPR